MSYQRIRLEFNGKVAVLTLNHPEVLNALGGQMLDDLAAAILEIEAAGTAARCLLLTGAGRAFCAGANLAEGPGIRGGAREAMRVKYHPVLLALRDLDMPIVTAVNGVAAGGGMSFAAMGDIICATKEAYFLQAFARIGLIPDCGATFLLPRLIGWGRAVELSMLAEKLPADKAYEWGLVNRLYDNTEALMAGAMEIAQRLAEGPRAIALMRRAYWESWTNSFEQQLELEGRLQHEAGRSQDFKEGVAAFFAKRPAKFSGE